MKKLDKQINRNGLIYEPRKYVYYFRKFWTKRSFGDNIFSVKITISETDKKQSNLLNVISNFNDKVRPRSKADKEKKTKNNAILMKVSLLFMKVKN